MIFMHSARIAGLMRDEPGGVWIDHSFNEPKLWLVAKLQMNLIREIDAGAATSLSAWVVEIDGASFAAFGFVVYDDPVHPMTIYGACRSTEEIDDLRALLGMTSVPVQIHNENALPVLHIACKFDPLIAAPVVDALPTGDYPPGDGVLLREQALNVVEASQESGAVPDSRITASCEMPLTFERKVHLKATVIGSGTTTLTDSDQGKELERHTFQLLDNLFPFGTFHSPQRDHTKGRLEVCDVLAVSRIREIDEEGIVVIQNKVAEASTRGLNRTTERRGLSIQKNILGGIDQAVGAIKKLKDGIQVYRLDGTKIEEDRPEVVAVAEPLNLHERAKQAGNGIVLVSDMHDGVDWELVWGKMLEAARETGYFFHVLDLQELQKLVVNANGRPAMFEGFLVTRWKRMAERKSAFARFKFKV
jgi:hypothetical protein